MSLPGNRKHYNFDESKLKQGQRKAAALMVEYEFALSASERKTQQEIADEVGVHRSTIHDWNTYDNNFIEYKNYLAAGAMNAYLPFVYKKLIDGINNGSMKGIELFMKRMGEMENRSEITLNDNRSEDKSMDERRQEILKRLSVEVDGAEVGASIENKLNNRISKD